MAEEDVGKQAKQGHGGERRSASPVQNHRLRGENESFWDAMDQGREAKGPAVRGMIADILRRSDED